MTNDTLSDITLSVITMRKMADNLESTVQGLHAPSEPSQLQKECNEFLTDHGVSAAIAQELSVKAADNAKGTDQVRINDLAAHNAVKKEVGDIIASWRREADKLWDILRDEAKASGRELDDMLVVSKKVEPLGIERLDAAQLSKAVS